MSKKIGTSVLDKVKTL